MSEWLIRFCVGAGLCAIFAAALFLAAFLGGAVLALATIVLAWATGLSDGVCAYIVVIAALSVAVGVFWANFSED